MESAGGWVLAVSWWTDPAGPQTGCLQRSLSIYAPEMLVATLLAVHSSHPSVPHGSCVTARQDRGKSVKLSKVK